MIKRFILFFTVAVALTACKKEFSEVGADLTNPSFYRFEMYSAPNIKFYSHPVDRVKAVGQSLVAIGVYKHPAFGKTEADVKITFRTSEGFSSEHFMNADSILYVQLRIPFFSKKDEEQSTDDLPVYKVDSVFGSGPIKLEAYYNNYYLFPYDPNTGFTTNRQYYSDFNFMQHNTDLLYQNNQFVPDLAFFVDTIPLNVAIDDELDIPEEVKTGLRKDTIGPQFYINLDTTFFRHKIFDKAGQPQLTDQNLFETYFRGLYIHTEAVGSAGGMMLLDGAKVYLILAYRYSFVNNNGTQDDPSDDYVDHGYEKILLFGRMKVNVYRNDFYPGVRQAITSADPQTGQEKVYLKGDAGSMGMLQLFGPQELYELRNNDWIINQANLRFYVDETEMQDVPDAQHPKMLFLYKYDYRQPVSDLNPQLENGQTLDMTKVLEVYDGTLHEDSVTHQKYYNINITRTVKEILRKDSVNVRLGVRVTNDLIGFLSAINQLKDPDASTPFGTVLKGNLAADHPVELRIYYTEPQNNQ